jgi:hypothetical protein
VQICALSGTKGKLIVFAIALKKFVRSKMQLLTAANENIID